MKIAILTFEGFNELDSFIAFSILNRMSGSNIEIQICSPTDSVTSMNGLVIKSQQPLEYACKTDAVIFGSGIYTRDIAQNESIMGSLDLDPSKQLIAGQCSGTLLMAKLGLLKDVPACTDLTTKPWVIESGVEVLEQAFIANGNIATAGGCMASQYLAAWMIGKLSSLEAALAAIDYVAPVGEKQTTTQHVASIIKPFI